ncbi:MAG: hypothetical protein M0Z63_13755 [Actinomycetota bacterium]|nr:hypothetical protein [Actinomycetota bacterium]
MDQWLKDGAHGTGVDHLDRLFDESVGDWLFRAGGADLRTTPAVRSRRGQPGSSGSGGSGRLERSGRFA